MGYNTSMIVLNDALGDIAKDAEFGAKVRDAVDRLTLRMHTHGIDIQSGCSVNAATVIESHHADETAIIAVGGNCASVWFDVAGSDHHEDEFVLRALREIADFMGYKLVKSRKKAGR